VNTPSVHLIQQQPGFIVQDLTPEGRRTVESIAQRHGVSTDAAMTVLRALAAGDGAMAQFDHPELGGMGQWSQGGMTMVGDMFNHGLRARVDALCTELANLLRAQPGLMAATPARSQTQIQSGSDAGVSLFVSGAGSTPGAWWPAELGQPASAGAQNDLRYAVFPATRRLAVEHGGRTTLYDTGDHVITGVSQQQGGSRALTFTSQHGPVRLSDLPPVAPERPSPAAQPASEPPAPTSAPQAGPPGPARAPDRPSEDVLATLERLAELHRKGVLTDQEFTAKKAELLGRL
jgi:hypothetical protein